MIDALIFMLIVTAIVSIAGAILICGLLAIYYVFAWLFLDGGWRPIARPGDE